MVQSNKNVPLDMFRSFLEGAGLKPTRERLIIFNEALSTVGHFEADDLLVILKTKGRKTSRATVYRTLDLIARAGILRKIFLEDSAVQFEKAVDVPRHDHLICRKCGKKIEFFLPELDAIQKKLCETNGFIMSDYRFQIYGICSDCVPRKNEK